LVIVKAAVIFPCLSTVLAFILVGFLLFQKFLESLPCTERLRASSRDGSLSGADGKSGTNRSHPFPVLQYDIV
jgi:hypothetical protein